MTTLKRAVPRILTRQQLYDLVWERAVSKVAPELGISDVALRKQCKKHGIPLPDAVYWGRRHAGRPVARVPLPAAPDGQTENVYIQGGGTPAPQRVQDAVAAALEKPPVLAVPNALHSLVARTISLAKKAKPDERSVIARLGPEAFQIRVPPQSLERVGKLLNMIVRNALARGYRFASGKEGVDVLVDGEAIDFAIIQPMRQSRHVETEEERRGVERWDARNRGRWDSWEGRPTIPRYDYTPSGGLSLEIGGWSRYPGAQNRFVDSRATVLEDRVGDILVALAARAAAIKVAREEVAERQRQYALDEQRRQAAARQARFEEQRVAYLAQKLSQRDERDRLRSFVEELDLAALLKDEVAALFLAWAQERLDRLEASVSAAGISGELQGNEAFEALIPPAVS